MPRQPKMVTKMVTKMAGRPHGTIKTSSADANCMVLVKDYVTGANGMVLMKGYVRQCKLYGLDERLIQQVQTVWFS